MKDPWRDFQMQASEADMTLLIHLPQGPAAIEREPKISVEGAHGSLEIGACLQTGVHPEKKTAFPQVVPGPLATH